MLITNALHEFRSIAFAGDQDTKSWRSVELELRIPYILLSYKTEVASKVWVSQTSILWRDTDLVAACGELNESSSNEICEICLLMPGLENATTCWDLHKVSEVWQGREKSGNCSAVAYTLFDGTHLVNGKVTKRKNLVEELCAYRR